VSRLTSVFSQKTGSNQKLKENHSEVSNFRLMFDSLRLAMIFAPIAAILTNAIENQHADNINNSLYSTDNLTFQQWNADRLGNLVAIVSWPFQNLEINLKVQVLIRILSSLFLIIWIAKIVSRLYNASNRLVLAMLIPTVCLFISKYPEAGDTTLYGVAPQSIAGIVIVAALSSVLPKIESTNLIAKWLAFCFVNQLLWIVVGWLSILWLMRAPALILLMLFYLLKSGKIQNQKEAIQVGAAHSTFVVIAFMVISSYLSGVGENTSFQTSTIWFDIRHTTYIWSYLVLILSLSVLALVLQRTAVAGIIALASLYLVLSTVLVVGIDHIHDNLLDPRYFSMGYLVSITVACSGVFAVLSNFLERLNIGNRLPSLWVYKALGITIAVISTWTFFHSEVGFGDNSTNVHGHNKTGTVLDPGVYESLSKDHKIEFVAGGFWDVWPTVWLWRSEGIDILGLIPPGQKQKKFESLLDGEEHKGVCFNTTVENCVQTINIFEDYGVTFNSDKIKFTVQVGEELSSSLSSVQMFIVNVKSEKVD